jgi:hypothetical protein
LEYIYFITVELENAGPFHLTLPFLPALSQNVFHPPYNKVAAGAMVFSIVFLGYGSMYYGMRHQQYKQGYWK